LRPTSLAPPTRPGGSGTACGGDGDAMANPVENRQPSVIRRASSGRDEPLRHEFPINEPMAKPTEMARHQVAIVPCADSPAMGLARLHRSPGPLLSRSDPGAPGVHG